MKVGILTQHFLRNYGGIIQNYALQQVLLRLGHKPLTFEHDTCFTWWRWFLRCAKNTIIRQRLPEIPYRGRIGHHKFIDFIAKNICSVGVNHFTAHTHNKYGCDAYVVGSDQVWRPAFNIGERLYNMFLDFVPEEICKIAYAASFGVSEWEYSEEQTSRCRQLAKRFSAVSVREESGVTLCREYFDVDAVHVLDPTLLLEKEDYMKVCANIYQSKPHLFVYVLGMTTELQRVVSEISEIYGLNAEYIYTNHKMKENDSIEKWFAHFRDAEYIVTDSFHGMVFSIIFNKPFNVVMNLGGGFSRYESLLGSIGLLDRIVQNGVVKTDDINWNKVNDRLKEERSRSIDFINKSLKEE